MFIGNEEFDAIMQDFADFLGDFGLTVGKKEEPVKPKKHIFVVSGSGGVGKDTFMDEVAKLRPTKKISVADFAKVIAKQVGWDGGKTDADRKFLCDLKNVIDKYNDKNYQSIADYTDLFLKDNQTEILFVSMREPEQIKRFIKDYGAKTILVTSTRVAPVKTNVADASVFDMEYDIHITNDGTLKDLQKTAAEFVKGLSKTEYKFKKNDVVYVSHPFQGKEENIKHAAEVINSLQEKYPDTIFISPIHCFGFQYDLVPWSVGLERCLWLLDHCDIMLDCDTNKDSKGCKAEREYCDKNKIPYIKLEDII